MWQEGAFFPVSLLSTHCYIWTVFVWAWGGGGGGLLSGGGLKQLSGSWFSSLQDIDMLI